MYGDNKPSNFKVNLARLELHGGKWKVCLSSISFKNDICIDLNFNLDFKIYVTESDGKVNNQHYIIDRGLSFNDDIARSCLQQIACFQT